MDGSVCAQASSWSMLHMHLWSGLALVEVNYAWSSFHGYAPVHCSLQSLACLPFWLVLPGMTMCS